MPITSVQRTALEEVIHAIITTTAPRGKRQLCAMFMDLVDRAEWPQYYELIPEPRCLNNIRSGVEKHRYKDPMDAYTDLSLVFWNAMFYNEPDSQIALDAETLKGVLETEWKKRPVLPMPRTSPPPSSAQKVHHTIVEPAHPQPVPVSVPVAVPAPKPVPVAPPAPTRTATPIVHNPPVPPPASTSTSTYLHPKPVPIRPRSAQRQPSPDMEVDVSGMSPEPEGQVQGDDVGMGVGMDRDPESEEIVRQLEKGLPRWQGFGDNGWMEEFNPDRYLEIVHAIKSHKDVIGNRLAVAFEAVPEESNIPNLSYTFPLSLKSIESRVRAKSYSSSKEFDKEMAQLFEKARRWYEPCTEPYGRVLLLQRLYQALTSAHPPPGIPYSSSTNFASLRAGPGNVKPVHGVDGDGITGVTTHRVLVKDRTFVDELHYKGWSVKLADWLHLSNPDDPSRPIIGQVFRCWVSEEFLKKGQPGLTVSWYYRPEQTFHPATRQFWEREIFKSSHFADHALEDIIEKIACQFTARHIRGRPRPPFWYPGFPLYVCDSRYNDRDHIFVKIKNWNSCVPEEVRKSTEFMPIYPFEQTVFPNRIPSPFLTKGGRGPVKGPGGIADPAEKAEGERGEGEGSGRKRTRRAAGDGGPNKGLYVGAGIQGTNAAAATSNHHYQPSHLSQQLQPHMQRSGNPDKSFITAAGGLASLGSNPQMERLPPETTKHFDRDPETNEVLWFAAPPVHLAHTPAPKHSLTYLHFLATKRKQESENGDAMDVDGVSPTLAKKRRQTPVSPTVTETLAAVLKDMSKT